MIDDKDEPAFPQPDAANRWPETRGMSLRDYFAAKGMQGVLSNPNCPMHIDEHKLARECYAAADAMLKVREL